jgi:hypothetical protein
VRGRVEDVLVVLGIFVVQIADLADPVGVHGDSTSARWRSEVRSATIRSCPFLAAPLVVVTGFPAALSPPHRRQSSVATTNG